MRRILARMIIAFSKFVTYPLSPFRRASALAIACEGLYDEASFVTEQARLRFHATSRRGFDGEWSYGTSETDTIDDFVKIFSPDLPTHVKIDVDGIEADFLRGGRRVLSAPSVKSVIVEIEGDLNSVRNQEIMLLMTELGFSARTKQSPDMRNVMFDKLPQCCRDQGVSISPNERGHGTLGG